jgi:predicted AlkP superfamily phosphohydrolase/phosphomutase
VAGDPVRDVYAAIDEAIGTVLARVDDDVLVILYAGHGMGPRYQGQYALAETLIRLGVAVPAVTSGLDSDREGALRRMLSWGWRRAPAPVRRLVRPHAGDGGLGMAAEEPLREIDAAASQCFIIPNNNFGGIRVNLVGREPTGQIRPGAELEAFCARLNQDLMELVNLADGKRLVRRVIRTKEVYDTAQTAHFPDLLVEWAATTEVRGVASPKIGEIKRGYDYCRTGDHKPGGFFVARGPGVVPGLRPQPVSIMDFAPTFCALLDAEPMDADGAAIPELSALARAVG